LAAGARYLRISAAGVPAVLVALVGNGYLRGRSDTRTPLVVLAAANALNLVLEILFVYGFDWGLAGSAWGTVIAQWVAAVWFGRLMIGGFRAAGGRLAPDPVEMRRMIVVGRDLFVRTGAIIAAFAAATAVAARLGPRQLAAHQVAYQLFLFLALSVDALAIAGQALVGTALGAGDEPGAVAIARRLVARGLQVGAVLLVALVAGAAALPHLFTADVAVARQAEPILVILGVLQVPGATAFVLDGVLMGASDFRYLAMVSVASLVLFVPFAAAVLADHHLGLPWLWGGLAVWMTGRAAANGARVVGRRWVVVASRSSPAA
ncbi:MAG: family efflux transporter, partial [Acidimicrobiales bacterium]|nr:family efflux transporter [Acidimicrobiales bacterium]